MVSLFLLLNLISTARGPRRKTEFNRGGQATVTPYLFFSFQILHLKPPGFTYHLPYHSLRWISNVATSFSPPPAASHAGEFVISFPFEHLLDHIAGQKKQAFIFWQQLPSMGKTTYTPIRSPIFLFRLENRGKLGQAVRCP